jgi:hypothetical protein
MLTFVFETSKLDMKDDWNMLIKFSKKSYKQHQPQMTQMSSP